MRSKILLCVALWCAAVAGAQTPRSSTLLTPNFQNTDVAVVANSVSEATGITFIPDPAAAARKITFVNRRPMTPQEYYDAFLSILSVHGLAALPAGRNTMKIVQEANARTLPGRELSGATGPDEMVHVVVPVRNVNSQQVATVLNQFRSQYGVVQAVPGTNQIIINDRAANVQRMRNIIERVDTTSGSDLEVIPLQYATAGNLVETLNQLMGGQQQAANQAVGIAPRITADSRTNSILVMGEPAARLQVAAWVSALDTPLAEGGGEPAVIYLRHGSAEELAPLLKEFATGVAQAQAVAAAGGGATGAAPSVSVSTAAVDRSITILAEPSTNALIVTAPPKMMRELSAIIEKLDIPRAQVLLETIIAEVSTDKAAALGVNWAVFSDESGTTVPAGGFISPIAGASIANLASLVADPEGYLASGGGVPNGTTLGVGRIRENGVSLAAVLRALRTDSDSNVIAQPQILALDNQEVELTDGQEVPFLSGFTSSLGSTGGQTPGLNLNPVQNVTRQQIGTTLRITPQINDGGTMTLDIQIESSELAGVTGDAGSQITNNRELQTKVRVENGQTIVLGGMVRNSASRTETRVPFLGRIPLIGELFRTRGGENRQRMLMVFIRPTILADSTQMGEATRQKYNLIRDEQMRQGTRREVLPLLPGTPQPQLPEIEAVPNAIQPGPQEQGATTAPVP
jgi:general secretion pathway protein D